jgi:DNA mismatch endonuclease (patch repair protein)
MQGNRRSGTGPERLLSSELHRRGLRYRRDLYWTDGTVRTWMDFAFTRPRVAVYVDGCLWHGCPEHCRRPKTNTAYWSDKFEGNVARDRRVDLALREAGWLVIRAFEHEPPARVADLVQRTLASRKL